jgi:hypothetical protein
MISTDQTQKPMTLSHRKRLEIGSTTRKYENNNDIKMDHRGADSQNVIYMKLS